MSAAVISPVTPTVLDPPAARIRPKSAPTEVSADAASTEPDFARFDAPQPTPPGARQPGGPRQPPGPEVAVFTRRDSHLPTNRAAISSPHPAQPPPPMPSFDTPSSSPFNIPTVSANQMGHRQPAGPIRLDLVEPMVFLRTLHLALPIQIPPTPPSIHSPSQLDTPPLLRSTAHNQ